MKKPTPIKVGPFTAYASRPPTKARPSWSWRLTVKHEGGQAVPFKLEGGNLTGDAAAVRGVLAKLQAEACTSLCV